MSTERLPSECRSMERLWERTLEGHELTDAERAAWDAHLQECEVCRNMARGLDAIRFRAEDPPLEPLDDVTAHRMVTQALERAEERGRNPDSPAAAAPASADQKVWAPKEADQAGGPAGPRSKVRVALFLAASSLALAATLLVVVLLPRNPESKNPASGTTTSRSGGLTCPSATSHTILVAGTALYDGRPLPVGARLDFDGTVTARDGQATVALPELGFVRLHRNTKIQLVSRKNNRVHLLLQRGTVDAFVDPASRIKLGIEAGSVQVRVLGTFLRVEKRGACIRVSVLHGLVAVSSPSAKQSVSDGEGWDTCSRVKERLGRAVTQDLWNQEDRLHLLDADGGALLTIRSQSPGAQVVLDGTAMGETPLTALVKPGYRKLELSRAGKTLSSRYVHLRSGAKVRQFLSPDEAGAAGGQASGSGQPENTETEVQTATGRWSGRVPSESRGAGASRAGAAATRAATKTETRPATGHVGPSPAARLLEQAQSLRSRRQWRKAARAYAAVIRKYGSRHEARVAILSLASLELEHLGHPAKALNLFRRYLALGGSLAQEARWGIIQAFAALGRTTEERSALKDFLARYPHSVRADRARRRLGRLGPGQASQGGK